MCCGPGGVGKTTVSASLAVGLATAGRRVCVITVDPARRLADALGLAEVSNLPTKVPGERNGELWAVMLDSQGTFDDLVRRYSSSDEQAAKIRANRLYQNLSSSLGGTQEYMAMEKLYELTTSGAFDLVIVDTPPTRNALDLLDAPRRLTNLLENKIFRALLMPTKAYLRVLGVATQALLRTISVAAGAELVADAVAFFQAFAGMEDGFSERARAVKAVLEAEGTRYVVVTSPRPDAVAEARFFAQKLADAGTTVTAMVVNRIHPSFGPVEVSPDPSLEPYLENLAHLERLATADRAAVAGLVAAIAPAPVGELPLMELDIADRSSLMVLAGLLVGSGGASPESSTTNR